MKVTCVNDHYIAETVKEDIFYTQCKSTSFINSAKGVQIGDNGLATDSNVVPYEDDPIFPSWTRCPICGSPWIRSAKVKCGGIFIPDAITPRSIMCSGHFGSPFHYRAIQVHTKAGWMPEEVV